MSLTTRRSPKMRGLISVAPPGPFVGSIGHHICLAHVTVNRPHRALQRAEVLRPDACPLSQAIHKGGDLRLLTAFVIYIWIMMVGYLCFGFVLLFLGSAIVIAKKSFHKGHV